MNKKLKKFAKEHKHEIVATGGIALCAILSTIIAKKFVFPQHFIEALPDIANNVGIPTGFAVGEITELWKEGEWLNAIVNELTTSDIGRLGEEFVKHGIVANDTKITMLIGFI